MPNNICIVCNAPNTDVGKGGSDSYQYSCPNCGKFILTGTAKAMLGTRASTPGFVPKLSYEIRRKQRTNEWPEINPNVINYVDEESKLPSVAEQADNLILVLGKTIVSAEFVESYENMLARVGAETPGGVKFIYNALVKNEHHVTQPNLH